MFSEKALKRLGCASVVDDIKQKQRGGSSGKAGYRYEDYFILFKLTEAANPATHRKHKNFRLQEGAFCLVDDIVTQNGLVEFYQLKTSPKTSWGGGLLRDFESQVKICRKSKTKHRLHLVTPRKSVASRLSGKVPKSIQGSVDVVFFPLVKRRRELWQRTSLLYSYLTDLCADPNPTPEALEALVTAFEIAWRDCSLPGRFTPLSRILQFIHRREDIPLRQDWKDASREWREAKGVLSRIKGLSIDTSRGFFCYVHNGESGRFKCGTPSYRRFLKRVNKSKPSTFDEFMETLP